MLLLAHRGDHARVPENTLAAFAAAVARPGCDGVEFDVRASADGVAVVLHDATLARVQGRPERADSLSAAQLDAAGVPTLAAVLEICGPDAFLDVELKEDLGRVALDPLLAARGRPDGSLSRAVISAFEPASLATIRHLAPAVACWLNAEGLAPAALDLAVALGCLGISVEWRAINARTAAAVARAGLDLATFTFTTRRTLARLERLGVRAACVEGAALAGDRERPGTWVGSRPAPAPTVRRG
jgi:glycerophosphoryl diester phosphodiesterase